MTQAGRCCGSARPSAQVRLRLASNGATRPPETFHRGARRYLRDHDLGGSGSSSSTSTRPAAPASRRSSTPTADAATCATSTRRSPTTARSFRARSASTSNSASCAIPGIGWCRATTGAATTRAFRLPVRGDAASDRARSAAVGRRAWLENGRCCRNATGSRCAARSASTSSAATSACSATSTRLRAHRPSARRAAARVRERASHYTEYYDDDDAGDRRARVRRRHPHASAIASAIDARSTCAPRTPCCRARPARKAASGTRAVRALEPCDHLLGGGAADVDDRRADAGERRRLRRAEVGVVDAGDRDVVGDAHAALAAGEHAAHGEHVVGGHHRRRPRLGSARSSCIIARAAPRSIGP